MKASLEDIDNLNTQATANDNQPDPADYADPEPPSGAMVSYHKGGQIAGALPTELKTPLLKIAHPLSSVTKAWPSGTIVYAEEFVVEQPAKVVAVELVGLYQEKVAYKPGAPAPEIFSTLEQVTAAGGVSILHKSTIPPADHAKTKWFQPVAWVGLLIKWPGDPDGAETYEINGETWARARWFIKSFKENKGVVQPLYTAAERSRLGLSGTIWDLTTYQDTYNGYTNPVAKIVKSGKTDDAFIAALRDLKLIKS
jgi:hypothetical protein